MHNFPLLNASDCGPCVPMNARPLLSPVQAGGLAAVFQVLGSGPRLRLLHALVRANELTLADLSTLLGMPRPVVARHMQRLVDLGIIASRREGDTIHLRLIDLCVRAVLDQSLCLTEAVSDPRRRLMRPRA